MNNKIDLKKAAIKLRLANQMRTDVYPIKYGQINDLPVEQKVELFDKWAKAAKKMHFELENYRGKKADRKKLHEQRLANGYYEKKQAKAAAHSVTSLAHKINKENILVEATII